MQERRGSPVGYVALDTVDGKLAVGGLFYQADGIPVDHIAFWHVITTVPEFDEDHLVIRYNSSQSAILIDGEVAAGSIMSVHNNLGQEIASFKLEEGQQSQEHVVDFASGAYVCTVYGRRAILTSRKILVTR